MLIYAGFILFAAFALVNTLFIQPFAEFQGWSDVAGGILLIGYVIICSIQSIKNPFENEGLDSLVLWMNAGVLFYFAFNMYLFASTSYIFKQGFGDIAIMAWGFHNFNNIVKNVLFAVGIYSMGRKFKN